MKARKRLLVLALVLLVGSFFAFDLGQFFSLDFLKSQQAAIALRRAENPVMTSAFVVGATNPSCSASPA